MTEAKIPLDSKKFIKVFILVSLIWFTVGLVIHTGSEAQILAFVQIFLFSFLDLVFIILLFWNIFFIDPLVRMQRANKIRIMLFGFFKLVCLIFLAITLKRLRNASTSAHLMGVSIIWIGPLISGVYLRLFSNLKND